MSLSIGTLGSASWFHAAVPALCTPCTTGPLLWNQQALGVDLKQRPVIRNFVGTARGLEVLVLGFARAFRILKQLRTRDGSFHT